MKSKLIAATLVAGLASPASAATVDITLTEFGSVADAVAAQNAFTGAIELAYEDFEGFCSYDDAKTKRCEGDFDTAGLAVSDGGTGDPLMTALGNMRALSPEGSGASSVPPQEEAIVRSATETDTMFGRYDADRDDAPDYDNYLDSNDNGGMRLNVPGSSGLGMFNQISFLLMDIDDVGTLAFELTATDSRNISVSSSDIVFNSLANPSNQNDGDLFLATFSFSELVDGVTIDMLIDDGDGFGIDSMSAAVVPLPAAGWMLLAGIGGLFGLRRFRKTA